MGFVLALQFLTRLPVFRQRQGEITERDLARSMAYYPLVGAFLGLILALANQVAVLILPPTTSAVLLMAILVLITGNLHWDGWMDTADGLLSGHRGQRALDIMKDSRVGASGVVWASIAVLAQYSLMSQLLMLPIHRASAWLIASLAWSRWNAVIATFMFPYARTEGTAQAFLDEISPREVVISTITALIIGAVAVGWGTLALLGVNLTITIILGKSVERRIGGITGDVMGAMILAGELIGLLIAGLRL